LSSLIKTVAAATLAAAAFIILPTFAGDAAAKDEDRVRLRCKAKGSADISMQARYEARGTRRKFRVEFEAAPGTGFSPAQILTFTVAGLLVGSAPLIPVVTGDVEVELEFDSKSSGDLPFPPNFPTSVVSGVKVEVKKLNGDPVLSCNLV
jgi:hypothetical protein